MSRARQIADFGDGIATADIDDGAVTAAKIGSLPAGSVIQVVKGEQSGSVVISTTGSFVEYISANITPSSTDSRIFVIGSYMLVANNNSTTGARFRLSPQITRDGTVVSQLSEGFQMRNNQFSDSTNETCVPCTFQCLDSPSSISQVTYKYGVNAIDLAGSTVVTGVNVDLILMEIAG